MSGDIEIKSYEGLNQTISGLEQTNTEVSGKKGSAESVATAVTQAGSNGQSGAPAFSATMESLSSMMEDVQVHVKSAEQSVGNAASDLRSLNTGQQDIQNEGAQKVQTA